MVSWPGLPFTAASPAASSQVPGPGTVTLLLARALLMSPKKASVRVSLSHAILVAKDEEC